MKPTKAEVHLVERARLSCDTQKKNPDKPRIEAFFTFKAFILTMIAIINVYSLNNIESHVTSTFYPTTIYQRVSFNAKINIAIKFLLSAK